MPYRATIKAGGSVNFIISVVICAVLFHFNDKMWGSVDVLRRGKDDE